MREPPKIAIREVTVPKRKPINIMVVLHRSRAVIEEAPNTATLPSILAYNHSQTVERADSVYASSANLIMSLLSIPQLYIPTPSFLSGSPELELRAPVVILFGMVRPHASTSVARVWRRQDDAIGKDVWRVVILACQYPACNVVVVVAPDLVTLSEALIFLDLPAFCDPFPVVFWTGERGYGEGAKAEREQTPHLCGYAGAL
jgi:hypothetical protein